jgi:hypothetical protein
VQRNYTKREREAAATRHLYVIMGHPSQKVFEEMLTGGKLLNNTVMTQDYRNALVMYGEDFCVLKGKMTKKQPEHVQVMISSKAEPKKLILSIDIMFLTFLSPLVEILGLSLQHYYQITETISKVI